MSEVGVEPTINKWDKPLALGAVDPHDSLSHPAGVADAQAESAASVDPDQFVNFLVHSFWCLTSTSKTGNTVHEASNDLCFCGINVYGADPKLV